jgi:hypothetical protein
MVLLVFMILIAVAVLVRLVFPPLRRSRVRAELRKDCWTRFEREFRAYSSRSWEAARESERGDP